MSKEIRYIDLFAGVGGIRQGFEQALESGGYKGKCVMTSEIKASAKKVYWENFGEVEIEGDITEVEASSIGDFDYLLGGFPCFVGSTKVLTGTGYKRIDRVEEGDMVLSHDKLYHRVTALLDQGTKATMEVSSRIFEKIEATSNHRFYVREVSHGRGGRKTLAYPEWLELGELKSQQAQGREYYMGTALNQRGEYPDKLGIEGEEHSFWYKVGEYLGGVPVEEGKESQALMGEIKELPCYMYNLPEEALKELARGYVGVGGRVESKERAYNISHLLMKGLRRGYGVEREDSGGYRIKEVKESVYESGYIWYPIREIKETGREEQVWDISVEGSHSFIANHSIAHNCQAFSVAGHRRGFEDTRGTLFFDIARILAEKRPQGFLLENVEGLLTHKRTPEQKASGEVGETLRVMLEILEEMGYKVSYKVLEGVDFGVPQRRRRIFILGDLDKEVDLEVLGVQETKYIRDITEKIGYDKSCSYNQAVKRYLKERGEGIEYLYGKQVKDVRGGPNNIPGWDLGLKGEVTAREKEILDGIRGRRRQKANKETKGAQEKDFAGLFMSEIEELVGYPVEKEVARLLELGYLAIKEINGYETIDLRGSRLSYKYAKILDPDDFSLTLVATDARVNAVVDGGGLRGLTKRELMRLNGFPEGFTMESVSRNQSLDLMGNTVIVPIVECLAKRLIECKE